MSNTDSNDGKYLDKIRAELEKNKIPEESKTPKKPEKKYEDDTSPEEYEKLSDEEQDAFGL